MIFVAIPEFIKVSTHEYGVVNVALMGANLRILKPV